MSDEFADRFYRGNRPNGIYIPRFRNLNAATKQKDYLRGFGYQGGASRTDWTRQIKELSLFVTLGHGVGGSHQAVRERGFPVVDVGDDREIAGQLRGHGKSGRGRSGRKRTTKYTKGTQNQRQGD